MVNDPKRSLIVAQACQEISFSRRHKEGKIANWHKNESMYFGNKQKTDDARANVDLGRAQEFVHTLLSKIDAPLTFNFVKKKRAQSERVMRLNALKAYDSDRDNWDLKDIAGKKQCLIYGRTIFSYFASSDNGYEPNLNNVDVYDFLIDPTAGGLDIEKARYLGRWGIVKDRSQLKGSKLYIKTEIDRLLNGVGNSTVRTQEERDKDNRAFATNVHTRDRQIQDKDKFVFWEWFTTFEGERYYLLLDESTKGCIRAEKLETMFKSKLWPFWTYAAFPDLTEFWTPSYLDYAREIFMAQAISINQMLDNAEQVNKPQKVVDVTALENLADLKYRRGGNYIRAKSGAAANAVKILEVPSIDTPIKVFNTLEQIQSRASGVTDAAAGVADTDGRATIYEGNAANTADRFGLLNKSYTFGYKRFAKLWEHGVREHLTKKISVDVLGPDGIDLVSMGPKDLFKGKEDFAVMVESSMAELQMSNESKRTKMAFLSSLASEQGINRAKRIEMMGKIATFTDQELQELLDVENYGDGQVMAEADRDIELILDGKSIEPNRIANTAYLERFVNYLSDHTEDIDDDTYQRMVVYMESLRPVVTSNTLRKAKRDAAQIMAGGMGEEAPTQPLQVPGPAQPINDVIEQNTP